MGKSDGYFQMWRKIFPNVKNGGFLLWNLDWVQLTKLPSCNLSKRYYRAKVQGQYIYQQTSIYTEGWFPKKSWITNDFGDAWQSCKSKNYVFRKWSKIRRGDFRNSLWLLWSFYSFRLLNPCTSHVAHMLIFYF